MRLSPTPNRIAALAGLALCAASAAAHPQSADDAEALRAIEESLAADAAASPPTRAEPAPARAAAAPILTPEIAAILDVAFGHFAGGDPIQSGGHDPTRNGFTLQQLELALGANVDPYFRFDANLVFSEFGVEVEEAYATTLSLPGRLQVRAGQFLTRFGRLNPTHPHTWDFVDQALIVGRVFGSEGNRGVGAELSWLLPLPWYVEVLGSTTDADGECCARAFGSSGDLGVRSPLDLQSTAAIKQFFPFGPSWSLSVGLSAANGPNATGNGNRTDVYGADLYLRWRPVASARRMSLALTAEGMLRRTQIPRDVVEDVGGLAQLVFMPSGRWALGARHEELGPTDARLASAPVDGALRRTSLAVSFLPTHFSRVRLQGATTEPRGDARGWSVFLALEVVAGAHGSHTF
jgi:hypothetical protein